MNNEEKKARIEQIDSKIRQLADERKQLSDEVAQSQSKFPIGCTIQWGYGASRKRKGIVRRIERDGFWETLFVQATLKSGALGQVHEVRPHHNPETAE